MPALGLRAQAYAIGGDIWRDRNNGATLMSDFIMDKIMPPMLLLMLAAVVGCVVYALTSDDPRIGAICQPGLMMVKVERTVFCAVPPIRMPSP